ncbi:MAG: hypothetical protein AAGK37_11010 [Pseudomonadota bacterium]
MSLRSTLEGFPTQATILVFTTLGHVYTGRLVDIDAESVTLGRPDGTPSITLNLNDVSGARMQVEEKEPNE